MAEQSDAKHEWCEVTPDDSNEGSSSSDGSGSDSGGSTSFESIEVTPMEKRKPRREEEEDPTFDSTEEAKTSHVESSDEDTGAMPKVLAYQ
jgi:hypothetical protein